MHGETLKLKNDDYNDGQC